MWLMVPIVVYSLVYLFVRHIYTYWQRKGYPSEAASLRWSFIKQVYRREFQHVQAVCDVYHEAAATAPAPATAETCRPNEALSAKSAKPPNIYGIYFSFRPILLIRDLDIAQTLLEQGAGHFNDGKWDYMRGYRKVNLLEKLAPMFAKRRLEEMYGEMEKVGDHMVRHLRRALLAQDDGEMEIDVIAVVRKYSINVFGNLLYGLSEDNFEKPEADFHLYVSQSLNNRGLTSYSLNRLPKKSSITYRLGDIIKENVEAREDGGCIRKDILQMLVKFRNANELEMNGSASDWHVTTIFESQKPYSVKKLSKIAESLLYMGVDAIESVLSLTLLECLRNPRVMQKLLLEVDDLKQDRTDGEKDKAKEPLKDIETLNYLNACVEETMRLYPTVPIIERKCCKNFPIPGGRHTISEGRTIMIPLMAMQRDEKYYPEPLIYRPERLLAASQQKGKVARVSYGFGGSSCVAENFSKLLIKIALMKILRNFQMSPLPVENPGEGEDRIGELTAAEPLEIVHTPTPFIKSRDGFKVKLRQRPTRPTFYL